MLELEGLAKVLLGQPRVTALELCDAAIRPVLRVVRPGSADPEDLVGAFGTRAFPRLIGSRRRGEIEGDGIAEGLAGRRR